jgi:hypothetical protein
MSRSRSRSRVAKLEGASVPSRNCGVPVPLPEREDDRSDRSGAENLLQYLTDEELDTYGELVRAMYERADAASDGGTEANGQTTLHPR